MATVRGSGRRWIAVGAAIATAVAAGAALAQEVPAPVPARRPTAAAETKTAVREPVEEAAAIPARPARILRTRFIIGLEHAVDAKDYTVSALAHPHRVLVDLPQIKVSLPELPGKGPVGVVRSFQPVTAAPGRMRIVIDVTGPVVIERKAVEKAADSHRPQLVLDIVAAGEVEKDVKAANAVQPPLPKAAVPLRKRLARSYKPVIVIDPGHGGEDSGAVKYGTVEKNVVLSFSLRLRDKLVATGLYKVLMTRDKDVFIPLQERRAFAERNQAALFIAIHADYTDRSSARGATIYSLRPYVADSLRRSAESEAAESGLTGKEVALVTQAGAGSDVGVVRGLLTEKARELIERNSLRTSVFARSLLNFVSSSTNMMDNPDRSAGFAVLKTAKVPAILLELGYVTNTQDAAQLNSDQWRDRVAGAMVTAINKFRTDCILVRVAC